MGAGGAFAAGCAPMCAAGLARPCNWRSAPRMPSASSSAAACTESTPSCCCTRAVSRSASVRWCSMCSDERSSCSTSSATSARSLSASTSAKPTSELPSEVPRPTQTHEQMQWTSVTDINCDKDLASENGRASAVRRQLPKTAAVVGLLQLLELKLCFLLAGYELLEMLFGLLQSI